jgi:hypothetical protein
MEPLSSLVMLVAAYGSMGVAALARARRRKLDRARSQAVPDALTDWALQAGFEVLDAFDPEVSERGMLALLLVAEDDRREIGAALRRRHANGELYLFDSFRKDGRQGRVTTCMVTTDASSAPRPDDALADLPAKSKMSTAPGLFVVHVPVPLDAALATRLVDPLTRLEAALPRVPGSGRF